MFSDCKKVLENEYKNIDKNTVKNFFINLIDTEVVYSELRPTNLNTDSFSHVCNVLASLPYCDEKSKEMFEVQKLVEQINKSEDKISIYESLSNIINANEKHKNPFNCNMIFNAENFSLPIEVKDYLEENINKLIILTNNYNNYDSNKKFTDAFLEKYGIYKEIKLLELFDSSIGIPLVLGTLSDNIVSSSIDEFINKPANLKTGHIELNDEDFKKYRNEDSDSYSFEFLINIISSSTKNIKSGDFLVNFSGFTFSSEAFKSWGRFTNFFTEKEKVYIKSKEQEKEQLFSSLGKLLVCLQETSENGMFDNLTNHISSLKFNVSSIPVENQINLNDLYVGCDKDTLKLYIKSKSLNKRLSFSDLSMLNINYRTDICRFLVFFSEECSNLGLNKFLQDINKVSRSHLPRIAYNKIILSPEQWYFDGFSTKTFDNFKNDLQKFCLYYKLPELIQYGSYDNVTALNTQDIGDIKNLYKHIKNNKTPNIKFYEIFSQLENNWLSSIKKKYASEVTLSFIRSKKNIKSNLVTEQIPNKKVETNFNFQTVSDIDNNKTILSTQINERIYYPHHDWLFYKIYTSKDNSLKILTLMIGFFNELGNKDVLDKMFYIRYNLPSYHIRLRIKLIDSKKVTIFLDEFKKFIDHLSCQCLVQTIEMDTYFPEYERYGGVPVIDLAENFFLGTLNYACSY